ncbi:MAG: hypothetical protein HYX67_07145 [Candidatus Melainabacteria bacterium]|nr:hypothetical protein [Candidatus Melainabacteria bacterium]
MDNEKLKESELEQKLVINELNLEGDSVSQSAETSADVCAGEADNQAAKTSTPSGKREPALIRVKNLKSRNEPKPSVPPSVRATRSRYIAIALITTLIGILIVPFAWAAWTLLKISAPQSAGVQFFMKPPDGSQVKADRWRSKMRSMIAQVSKMPAPPLTKPATGYGDPRVGQNALALLNEKEFGELNRIFANAKKDRVQHTGLSNSLYPNYVPTYLHSVYYLQPRWYGVGDEWVTYATKEADKVGGDEGDKLYARMVGNVAHLYNNLYQEVPSLNQKRVDRGNALLDKQFGGGK